jgi:hypothetical protein
MKVVHHSRVAANVAAAVITEEVVATDVAEITVEAVKIVVEQVRTVAETLVVASGERNN